MSEINYSNRIGKLKSRYNPDRTQLFEDRVHREITGLVGDTQKYVRMAMMAVDEEYTKKTLCLQSENAHWGLRAPSR